MDCICFKKADWLYIPVYSMAILIAVLAFVFFGLVFAGVIHTGHSISDELYNPLIYINYAAFW
jgi:hypothetical protein